MTQVRIHISPEIQHVIDLYGDLIDDRATERTIEEQLRLLATRLLDGHRCRLPGAFVELSNWHPQLVCQAPDVIWAAELTEHDALTTAAREHGYMDWASVLRESRRTPSPEFERATEAVLAGDLGALGDLLRAVPTLAVACSHWGHAATLLHYVAANGVETYRQRVPVNAPMVAQLLLERGARVDAKANMYGGNQTALGLLVTSKHPADAGVTSDVARV